MGTDSDGLSARIPRMDGDLPPVPTEKILCGGKFYRLVVACCRNCTEPQFCREFWDFFQKNGTNPQEYLRKFGIKEDVMKRIVFDCDRCGKKDIGEPVSVFFTDGEHDGERMTHEEFAASIERLGKLPVSKEYLGDVLALLHTHEGWEHYCTPCFRKVAQAAVGMLGPNAKSRRKANAEAGMSAAGRAIAARNQPKPVVLEPLEPEDPPQSTRGRRKA